MAQRKPARASQTQKHGNLYDDIRLRVYKDSMNVIIIEDIRTGTTMKINSSDHPDGGLYFITDGPIEPRQIYDGKVEWRVRRRR